MELFIVKMKILSSVWQSKLSKVKVLIVGRAETRSQAYDFQFYDICAKTQCISSNTEKISPKEKYHVSE